MYKCAFRCLQHVKDKFLNFMFYKFIFIFGVMNVQNMDEVLLLCTWFSVLCMLHLLTQLCKDRFEYVRVDNWWIQHVTASIATSKQIINSVGKSILCLLTCKCHVFRIAIKPNNLLPVMLSCSQYDTSRLK